MIISTTTMIFYIAMNKRLTADGCIVTFSRLVRRGRSPGLSIQSGC